MSQRKRQNSNPVWCELLWGHSLPCCTLTDSASQALQLMDNIPTINHALEIIALILGKTSDYCSYRISVRT